MLPVLGTFLLLLLERAKGLDITNAVDIDCLKPFPQAARNVDYEWMHSVETWFVPLQSRLNYWRYVETLLRTKIEDVPKDDVEEGRVCMSYKWDTPPKLSEFQGGPEKEVTYTITNVIENSFGFVEGGRREGAMRGRHYITLRDNKSFAFFTTCWADGRASWSVIATERSLPEGTEKEILDHAKSLGFNIDEEETFVVKENYTECALLKRNGSSNKKEL